MKAATPSIAMKVIGSDPVHKATIIPRGRALGMVMRLPERDQLSYTREKLKADICVAMGGRVSEELVFGYEKVTSGASMDIKMATQLARAMVTQFGMSDKLGPLAYGDNEEEVFLGHSVTRTQYVSGHTQKLIDEEIHAIVETGYANARRIIEENIEELHILAKGLLEYETLSGRGTHRSAEWQAADARVHRQGRQGRAPGVRRSDGRQGP